MSAVAWEVSDLNRRIPRTKPWSRDIRCKCRQTPCIYGGDVKRCASETHGPRLKSMKKFLPGMRKSS